jgi:hypothetical protein
MESGIAKNAKMAGGMVFHSAFVSRFSFFRRERHRTKMTSRSYYKTGSQEGEIL